jgi:hypothetical protein
MLICAVGFSGETLVVRTTSRGVTSTETTVVKRTQEGSDFRVEETGETESVDTLLAEDGTVKSSEVRTEDGDALMVSDGSAVDISGTWRGKPLRARYELKGLRFYGRNFGFAAAAFARGGFAPLRFPVINLAKPSKSTVLELKKTGTADYEGRRAIEVKLAPTGMLAAFWSARLLLDDEGVILRYEGNRGPGTPDFVSELVETKE